MLHSATQLFDICFSWTPQLLHVFSICSSFNCTVLVPQTSHSRRSDTGGRSFPFSSSSASSSARSITTFPVHSDRPTSTSHFGDQGFGHPFGSQPQPTLSSSHSSAHSGQRRRPLTPPSAYLNPLFVGSTSTTTNWFDTSKKRQNGWYAKMFEFVRRCWRPTQQSGDEPPGSSRGHKRTQSEAPGKERHFRANDREFNAEFGYAVSLF